ncbi:unnamed protein product [Arabidopsis thaliana]|uniref:Uncharacterized protein n=1 Tax=Arabidopsis thaliana TaxID=3702 RepID=A0A654G5R0_ARATH|nr:unnamed protein product [Arabidopsis thaliana]
MRSGAHIFNVRIATGFYAFDENFNIIHDAYIHERWMLVRMTVRTPAIPGVAFAQYDPTRF